MKRSTFIGSIPAAIGGLVTTKPEADEIMGLEFLSSLHPRFRQVHGWGSRDVRGKAVIRPLDRARKILHERCFMWNVPKPPDAARIHVVHDARIHVVHPGELDGLLAELDEQREKFFVAIPEAYEWLNMHECGWLLVDGKNISYAEFRERFTWDVVVTPFSEIVEAALVPKPEPVKRKLIRVNDCGDDRVNKYGLPLYDSPRGYSREFMEQLASRHMVEQGMGHNASIPKTPAVKAAMDFVSMDVSRWTT